MSWQRTAMDGIRGWWNTVRSGLYVWCSQREMDNGRSMQDSSKLKPADIFMVRLSDREGGAPLTYLPSCYVQSLLTPSLNQPQAERRADTLRLFTFLSLHLHHRISGLWLPPLLLCKSAPVLNRSFTHICKLISNLKPHPRPHPIILPLWLSGQLLPPSFNHAPSLAIPPSGFC